MDQNHGVGRAPPRPRIAVCPQKVCTLANISCPLSRALLPVKRKPKGCSNTPYTEFDNLADVLFTKCRRSAALRPYRLRYFCVPISTRIHPTGFLHKRLQLRRGHLASSNVS